jgi:hypothetical protein
MLADSGLNTSSKWKVQCRKLFLSLLRQFLTEKLIIWMEVLNSRYPFQTLYGVREWLQVSVSCQQSRLLAENDLFKRTFPSESTLIMAISGSEYSQHFIRSPSRLSYTDRREDALEAILEAVDLHRRLAADRPAAFNADLAQITQQSLQLSVGSRTSRGCIEAILSRWIYTDNLQQTALPPSMRISHGHSTISPTVCQISDIERMH